MEISLAAEKLFNLEPIEVTNSLFSAFLIVVIFAILAIIFGHTIRYKNPSKGQIFLEIIIKGFRGMTQDILGEKRGNKLFAFLFTFFVFIVASNWFGLLPFVGPIVIEHEEEHEQENEEQENKEQEEIQGINENSDLVAIGSVIGKYVEVEEETAHEENDDISFGTCLKERDCILGVNGIERKEAYPVFRAPTSDVSATLALSIISIITIHGIGITSLRGAYIKKFFNFSDPMGFFVGILEFVSEIGKLISFTFRLFGNVFAGEVLLLVITSISFGLATLPFMALEVFVGFIQAFVFFMLTSVFISTAAEKH